MTIILSINEVWSLLKALSHLPTITMTLPLRPKKYRSVRLKRSMVSENDLRAEEGPQKLP